MAKNPEDNNWQILITTFGGFCPAYFENSYPFYGNENQASDMVNADITDLNVLTQGPGVAALTNGTQAGSVSTLISSILKTVTASDVSFATGGAIVYKISSTTVSNTSPWPLTINKDAVTGETATDQIFYKSNLYVFYNHSGSVGDIAKVDIAAETIDPDWGSTVPTGYGTLQSAPHYAINGGDDVVYFTNGQYIGTISGTTLTLQGLDFWTNAETVSVSWNANRVIIAVNRPNISGSNFNESGIYNWNGVSSSWEGDPIEVSGKLGALYTKNGITYVWWQDATDTSGFLFGYINGSQLTPLRRYSGTLPNQAQVGEYKGYVAWISNNKIMLWGAKDQDTPVRLFQYMQGKDATLGAFAAPFGTIMISSTDGASAYTLAKASGYVVSTTWNTVAFNKSGPDFISQIDLIKVHTQQLASGAKCDFTLQYDQAKSSKALTQIAYAASTNITRHKIYSGGIQCEDFMLSINFANGSVVNPVKIRAILIKGHIILET